MCRHMHEFSGEKILAPNIYKHNRMTLKKQFDNNPINWFVYTAEQNGEGRGERINAYKKKLCQEIKNSVIDY
jgi:hypothetical protein